MHGHPTQGVKNAKPRLSSKPGPQIGKLSEDYLRIRNAQMRAKTQTAEMTLAHARGQLVERRLIERQAAFLLIAMRQKILNLPTTYARRMVGLKDTSAAKKMLQGWRSPCSTT
jgi:hypothetical protein